MTNNIANLSEQEIRNCVRRFIKSIMNESCVSEYYDDEPDMPQNASQDFDEFGFEEELKEMYPDMEFDFEVEDDGTVIVTDIETGNQYIGQGDVEYETTSLGYPSANDPYSEAEGEVPYFDFKDCFRTIVRKIDSNKPDRNQDDFVRQYNKDITNKIHESIERYIKLNCC